MRIKFNTLLLAVLLPGPFSTLDAAERWMHLDACELSAAGGRVTASARCGTLEVPENPDDPEGRRIELAYAVMPARTGEVEPDPVVFLAGGPGQSAREAAPLMRGALREINRRRDLVFLDQRGTGGSNILDCDFGEMDAFLEPDWDEWVEAIRECLHGFDADVRFYTTTDAADDLEALRRHLDFGQVNLIGGSYGTRLAQVYLRRYPDAVRSVILDGVVPTRLALGAEHAEMLDRTLARLFDACAADSMCNERFPDLDRALTELKAAYRDNGPVLRVADPRTGADREVEFTAEVLAGSLRFLAYAPHTQALIPLLVHEAAASGDPTRLAAQALVITEDLGESIAVALNFAVGCSEDWPRWPADHDASGTLLGNSMAEMYQRVCAFWPAGEVDDDFHRPFDSDVPVLLLSGRYDPVTPPEYGDEAERQFSNSRHLVAAGRGHIVITHRCIASIATEFVAAAALDELDTECMQQIGPEPFFLDLLGPAP